MTSFCHILLMLVFFHQTIDRYEASEDQLVYPDTDRRSLKLIGQLGENNAGFRMPVSNDAPAVGSDGKPSRPLVKDLSLSVSLDLSLTSVIRRWKLARNLLLSSFTMGKSITNIEKTKRKPRSNGKIVRRRTMRQSLRFSWVTALDQTREASNSSVKEIEHETPGAQEPRNTASIHEMWVWKAWIPARLFVSLLRWKMALLACIILDLMGFLIDMWAVGLLLINKSGGQVSRKND